MPAIFNPFKEMLKSKERAIGCWLGFGEATCAEMMGTIGFDWLVIDAEHGPNDIRSIRDQLVVLENSESNAVVRLPSDEVWMIKQALDVGAQTLLVPMVETAQQAEAIVSAMRYPPDGIRGMGATLARATRFGEITDYATTANSQLCLIVQVETVLGMSNLQEIAEVEGVDGVFIGPADLSADMGFPGNSAAPDVVKAMEHAAKIIDKAGKSAGSLALDDHTAQSYAKMGYSFLAVAIDVVLLMQSARAKAKAWK